MLASYLRCLAEAPLLTKSLTCTVGFGLGDALAQGLAGEKKDFDWGRFWRMVAFGTLIAGPQGHFWFGFLDKTIRPHAPTAAGTVVAKMLLDQLLMTPVNTCVFFAAMDSMERGRVDPGAIRGEIRDKLGRTLLAGYTLWPLAHLVGFRFVPPHLRIAYINAVVVGWTAILSTLKSGGAASSGGRAEGRAGKKHE